MRNFQYFLGIVLLLSIWAFSGWRAVTKVVDNGTSHNDPADQISYSYFDPNFGPCSDYINANFELLNIFCGQVKVKDSE